MFNVWLSPLVNSKTTPFFFLPFQPFWFSVCRRIVSGAANREHEDNTIPPSTKTLAAVEVELGRNGNIRLFFSALAWLEREVE